MRMTGEERIAAPRGRVWEALNDPAVLRACIPGCQSLEREPDGRLRATVEIRIGPIGARFNGVVTLSDIDAPNGYTIMGEGQGGTVGHAKGGAKVRLADDGSGTLLSYEVDAEVGGRLAQLGGPIIDATAKQLAGKFFKKFGEVVSGGEEAPVADGAVSAAAPTQAPTTATQPAAAPVPVHAAPPPYPWGFVVALLAALIVGFVFGQYQATGGMMVMVAALLILATSAGYYVGKAGRQ